MAPPEAAAPTIPTQRVGGKVELDLWGEPELVIKDVHQRTIFMPGTKGAGKSYTVAVAANDLAQKGARYVILDPAGAIPRLSEEKDDDGNIKRVKPPREVVFRDELRGDNGEEVAQAILLHTELSFVLNMENLSPNDRVQFGDAFARWMHRHNTTATPIVVVIDEAQEFMPTILRAGMPYAVEMERWIRLGRNKGFGFIVTSQRFATVHPNVRELADAMVILRIGGRLNLAALKALLEDHMTDEELRAVLARVQVQPRGEAILFAPYDVEPGENPIKGIQGRETSEDAHAEEPPATGSMKDADPNDARHPDLAGELAEGKRKKTPPKGTPGLGAFGLEGTSYSERHAGELRENDPREPAQPAKPVRVKGGRITPTDGRGNARLSAWGDNKQLDVYANEPEATPPHVASAEEARIAFAKDPTPENRDKALHAAQERDRKIASDIIRSVNADEPAATPKPPTANAKVASAMGLDARKADNYDELVENERKRISEIEAKYGPRTRPGRIYKRLLQLIPDLATLKQGDARKSRSAGYMDLNLDVLFRRPATNPAMKIALSHYWRHDSGDMMADPDMQIVVEHDKQIAYARTFQQDPGIYRSVEETPGVQDDLNEFLVQWLGNAIEQGHNLGPDAPPTTPPDEPPAAPPAEPQQLADVTDDELVARLDAAPRGSEVFRWRKTESGWQKGSQTIDSAKLLRTARIAARAFALTLPATAAPAQEPERYPEPPVTPEERQAAAEVWEELRANAEPIPAIAMSQDVDEARVTKQALPTVAQVELARSAIGNLVATDDEVAEALALEAQEAGEASPAPATIRSASPQLAALTEEPGAPDTMPPAPIETTVPKDRDNDDVLGIAPKDAPKKRSFDVELIDPSKITGDGPTVWEQVKVRPFKEEYAEAVTREERRSGRTATEEDKDRGRYYTPAPIALAMYALADAVPGDVVLDPTAGEGALLRPFQTFDPDGKKWKLQACEMHGKDRDALTRRKVSVVGYDYFQWQASPPTSERPQRIVSNPPYGINGYRKPWQLNDGEQGNPKVRESAMAVLWKSLTELQPGGRLVAIVPYFWVTLEEGRGRESEADWRSWVQRNYNWHTTIKLWPEVFAKEDTKVTTAIIVIDRPAGRTSDQNAPEEHAVKDYDELYQLVFRLTETLPRPWTAYDPDTGRNHERFAEAQESLEAQVRAAAEAHARWLQQNKPDAIPPPPMLGRVPLPKTRVTVEMRNKRYPDKKLKLHQKEAVALALDAWNVRGYRGFVVGADPGLGKTAIANAILNQASPRRALLVTKNPQLVLDFIKEANEDWNRPITSLKGEKHWPEKDGWFACTYDFLADRCQEGKLPPVDTFDLVIFDESHTLNNFTGIRGAKKSSNIAKWGTYVADRAKRVLFMSATPYETLGQMRYLAATGIFGEPDVERAMRDGGAMTAEEAVTQAYTSAYMDWSVAHGARVTTGSIIFEKAPEELASVAMDLVMSGRLVKHDARLDGLNVHFEYVRMPSNYDAMYREKLWHWKHVHMRCKGAIPAVVGESVAHPHNAAVRERMSFFSHFKGNFPGVPHAIKPLDGMSLGAQTMFWNRRFIETTKVPFAIERGQKLLAEGRNVLFLTANISGLKDNYARTFKRSVQRAIVPHDWPELYDPHSGKSMELPDDPEWDTTEADPDGKKAAQPKLKYVNEEGVEVTVQGRYVYYPADIEFYRKLVVTQQAYESAYHAIVRSFGGSEKVALYNGKMNEAQKDASKDDYNEERKHVMVATVPAAGTGLSLHDKKGPERGGRPRAQVTLTLPWTGKEFKQVSGRSHRLGSKSETHMIYPIGDTSSEARMARIVALKYRSMNASVSGMSKDDASADVNHSEFLKWDSDSEDLSELGTGDALFFDDMEEAAGEPTMSNPDATNVLDAYGLTVAVDPTKGGNTYTIETTDFSLRKLILKARNDKGHAAKWDSRRGLYTLSTHHGVNGVKEALERAFGFADRVPGGRFRTLEQIDAFVDAQLASAENAYYGWKGDEGLEWAQQAGLVDADEQSLWRGVIETYQNETWRGQETRVRFLRFTLAEARKRAENAERYAQRTAERGEPDTYWQREAANERATIARIEKSMRERGPINPEGKRSRRSYARPHMAHEQQRAHAQRVRVPTLREIRRLVESGQYHVDQSKDVRAYAQHDVRTDTVFVDRDAPPQDVPGLVVHEVAENELEKQGLPHEEAHPIANQIEREAVGEKQYAAETKRAQTMPLTKFGGQ